MLKKLSGYTLALIGLTAFFTSSCKKEYEGINSVDSTKIIDYIKQNNLTGMVQDSAKTGFYYQITAPGTGNTFTNSDSVLYNYSIKGLLNGTTYQDFRPNRNYGTYVGYTYNITYATAVKEIPAVVTVMNKLKPGGSARILVPSFLAFGKNGSGDIPSNENLDLTITVYPETEQTKLDDRLIKEFIAAKGLTMIKDPSGVYYSISAVGSGTYAITDNSSIVCNYTGRLKDGTVFDYGTDAPFTLGSGTIEGWTKTLPGKIEKGGKIRMLIPSNMAYGKVGGSIASSLTGIIVPANAILDFDVTISSVTQ